MHAWLSFQAEETLFTALRITYALRKNDLSILGRYFAMFRIQRGGYRALLAVVNRNI